MIIYCVIPIVLAIPLGSYTEKVMSEKRMFLSRLLLPVENLTYRVLGINRKEKMDWKRYSVYTAIFSVMSLTVLWIVLCFQNLLPLNPQGMGRMSWHLDFNTVSSFTTSTNWRAYSRGSSLSYFGQMIGPNFQNFVSAAVGIVVLFALIRGFVRVKEKGLGNFYTDITGTVLYILIPLSVVMSLAIVSQDVPQTFRQYDEVQSVKPVVVGQENGIAAEVTKGVIPLGPIISQIAIKQLGTNGGGFWGSNSACPFGGPTPLFSLFKMISLLLIPVGLCLTFSRNVKSKRQGVAVLLAMFIMPAAALVIAGRNEQTDIPQTAQDGVAYMGTEGQASGNTEGKETRFGIAISGTQAVFVTVASNGSANSVHDNYTPFGGLVPMLLMQLGEVMFGDMGYGLCDMLGFAILTMSVAGLMVGRAPEYLCRRIEPFEMKIAVLVYLAASVAIPVSSGIATLLPSTHDSLNNPGAHGLSGVPYAYSSVGGNNGSAFAGFSVNTPFPNVNIRLIILFVRFLPMSATLAVAGGLAAKKKVAVSPGTLPTHNAMFIPLLIFVVLLVEALSFFPALSLDSVAKSFQMITQGGQ